MARESAPVICGPWGASEPNTATVVSNVRNASDLSRARGGWVAAGYRHERILGSVWPMSVHPDTPRALPMAGAI